jgi:tRNA nucleotidyltransferase (CCA-adding enzyme)
VSITDHPITRPTLSRLIRALPSDTRALLQTVIELAEGGAVELWVVGGAVRDLPGGLPVRDLDLATPEDPAAFAAKLARTVRGDLRIEERFGTASIQAGRDRLDFAAFRTERYSRPGALPIVQLGASLEEDLARRDFTVNAVALGLSETVRNRLVDPFGGLADLEARRLRVLHDRSFIEDATRLWRGARYASRLRLHPDAATSRMIREGGRYLAPISAKRIWAEFERTAAERRVGATLALLERWGVLATTHPAFRLIPAAGRALKHRLGPLDPAVLLAVLLAPLPEADRVAVAARIGAPRAAAHAVADAARLLPVHERDLDALEVAATGGPEGRTAALWLDPQRQRSLQATLRRWERTASPLTPHDLMARGIEGAQLGAELRRLRREAYLGTLTDAGAPRRSRAAPSIRGSEDDTKVEP